MPPLDGLRGLSLDLLTALRWRALGALHDPASSPTAVVAIDEEAYRTPPFQNTPVVTWTREIGRVLNAVVEGVRPSPKIDERGRSRPVSRRNHLLRCDVHGPREIISALLAKDANRARPLSAHRTFHPGQHTRPGGLGDQGWR